MQNHESDMEGVVANAAAEGADVAESVISEAAASADKSAAPLADSDMPNGATAESATEPLVQQLEAELEAERARYGELFDKYQRSTAEFQNSRRRLEKQMADGIERASEHVVKKLLPVLDDLDLAFQHVPASVSDEQAAWVEGFRKIQKKLLDLLKDEGISPIPLDGPFDPTRHEGVTSEPSESVESGHIISTLRTGYEANGRVLRPALVRVAA
jgi:molecular chaperone GrpE